MNKTVLFSPSLFNLSSNIFYFLELKKESLIIFAIFPDMLELSICLSLHPQNNWQQAECISIHGSVPDDLKKPILFHEQLLIPEKRHDPNIFKAFPHKLCKTLPSHGASSGLFCSSTCSVSGEAPEQGAQRKLQMPHY